MNSRLLLLSTMAISVAGGVGIQLRRAAQPSTEALSPEVIAPSKGKSITAKWPKPGNSRLSGAEITTSYVPTESASAPEVPGERVLPVKGGMTAGPGGFAPVSERELRRRAALVEQEANHDLKHLVGLLDLTEAQQDRIFDTLVRHAPDWHPAMQAAGMAFSGDSTAKTASPNQSAAEAAVPAGSAGALDEIAAELTPDQQLELADSELDRQEWWAAILEQLESSLPTGTSIDGTAAAAPPSGESVPADTKAGEEPVVLGE